MDDDDDDECGTIGGKNGRGNRSTRRKPTSISFYPQQIPYDLTMAPTPQGGKPVTNLLSYGAAYDEHTFLT
jgi:hypothetical protein